MSIVAAKIDDFITNNVEGVCVMEVEKGESSVTLKTNIRVWGDEFKDAHSTCPYENIRIWKGVSGAMYIDIGNVGFGDPAIRLQFPEVDSASKLWEYVLLGLLAT